MTHHELEQVLDLIGDKETAGKGSVSLHPEDYADVTGAGLSLTAHISSGKRLFKIIKDAQVQKNKPHVTLGA